jgi:F0F1-type ATP synthase epsilon subunit
LQVELMATEGCVWRGWVSEVEIQMSGGALDIAQAALAYLQLESGSVLVLRTGDQYQTFQVEDAIVSLQPGKLTIVAKTIFPRVPLAG